jgi:hypothetical protein
MAAVAVTMLATTTLLVMSTIHIQICCWNCGPCWVNRRHHHPLVPAAANNAERNIIRIMAIITMTVDYDLLHLHTKVHNKIRFIPPAPKHRIIIMEVCN